MTLTLCNTIFHQIFSWYQRITNQVQYYLNQLDNYIRLCL